ncbi:predicted protein [Naegleria gruberi]|uniref:Predicted protein n=1 Tax=Naegleria gruberi TaxID=5762 RepID=D2W3T1_NAEGR|nr:uncharacterized protein NAEGRDRAFT_76055 [Naegleria gruberi]EFC36291.1 predicted protein [Naegleria gruberi]|eukprot:XP_002669035.1 predicted protein [Naegleria gruberi strain NEG-M]
MTSKQSSNPLMKEYKLFVNAKAKNLLIEGVLYSLDPSVPIQVTKVGSKKKSSPIEKKEGKSSRENRSGKASSSRRNQKEEEELSIEEEDDVFSEEDEIISSKLGKVSKKKPSSGSKEVSEKKPSSGSKEKKKKKTIAPSNVPPSSKTSIKRKNQQEGELAKEGSDGIQFDSEESEPSQKKKKKDGELEDWRKDKERPTGLADIFLGSLKVVDGLASLHIMMQNLSYLRLFMDLGDQYFKSTLHGKKGDFIREHCPHMNPTKAVKVLFLGMLLDRFPLLLPVSLDYSLFGSEKMVKNITIYFLEQNFGREESGKFWNELKKAVVSSSSENRSENPVGSASDGTTDIPPIIEDDEIDIDWEDLNMLDDMEQEE